MVCVSFVTIRFHSSVKLYFRIADTQLNPKALQSFPVSADDYWLCLSICGSTCTIHIHIFVSLGWKRGVATVPGGPPDCSGGGQWHQSGGSAGAACTQEAAAGRAGSQCKAFCRSRGPAGSQVPSSPYYTTPPLNPTPLGSPCLALGCSSFLSQHSVEMRYLPESCHILIQCHVLYM